MSTMFPANTHQKLDLEVKPEWSFQTVLRCATSGERISILHPIHAIQENTQVDKMEKLIWI